MCWGIWISGNDVVFDKGLVPPHHGNRYSSWICTIPRSSRCFTTRRIDRSSFKVGCRLLEPVAIEGH
jgi:hypothetical protein